MSPLHNNFVKTCFANKNLATNGSDGQPRSGSSGLVAARAALRFTGIPTLFLAILAATVAQAEPWSEKLGFPPGSKVVILEVRELGVTWESNHAGQGLLASGHMSAAGVIVTGPRFADVAKWHRSHPHVDLGVSIALTNPYGGLSWRLLTSELGPSSLVNADGYPWQSVVQLVVTASADDAKAELDAQIDRARKYGIHPTHISTYYGTLFSRADLAAVILGAARKYWLPAPVVELTPELIARFRQQGFPIDDEMAQLVREYPLPKLDDLRRSPTAETYEEKRALFSDLMKTLRPGLTLVILQPAEDSIGLRTLTPDWQQRVWDARMIQDEQVVKLMNEEQIIVTNWSEVMRRFVGEPQLGGLSTPATEAE